MQNWIDRTLYPDTDPPLIISTQADRVDFIARLCAAWDFGVLPYQETIDEICRPEWSAAIATLS